ncbi:hypothetical protein BJY24_001701 [Nocardia transvalensis]|uniref:HTH cro/C1-type domain-containing protein n=1 Tax=Nocardia transvalensis TaxID=37333 RepID=A0A7W9PB43_9NOCA|nr:hypothetical protein [Nocardia transvalensis]MBB5912834.1 hypothetical protein [Nocardia transvalensis]
MRIYANRCHSFDYRITAAHPCAVDLEPTAVVGATRPFFDCLVLAIGVDRGDLAVTETAATIVKCIAAQTDSGYIVIDGFARWAMAGRGATNPDIDVLTGLADALDVLSELVERLEERGELVHQMPFGWNTVRHADVMDGEWSNRVIDLGTTERPRQAWSLTPRALRSCGVPSR